MDTTEFIRIAIEVHGEKYTYDKLVYQGRTTKVLIICPLHGEFLQTPYIHLKGHGCPKCGGTSISSTSEFLSSAVSIHGMTYLYTKVVYTNNKSNVVITCREHGDFMQTPKNHLKGYGCPICGRARRASMRALSTEEFIHKAMLVHNNTFSYTKVSYINSTSYVTITCRVHGDFLQIPSNHLKYGCKQCAINNNSIAYRCSLINNKATILYYIELIEYGVWKIGCTSRTIEDRFKCEDTEIRVIHTKVYQDSAIAYSVEKYILDKTILNKNYIPVLKKGGNSELRIAPIDDIEELIIEAEGSLNV